MTSDDVGNSYNSLYGGLPKSYRAILRVLHESEFPLQACEIAEHAHLKPNSCRVYLRTLLKRNYIIQTGYGHYASKDKVVGQSGGRMGGVKLLNGDGLPRVHNVRLKVSGQTERVRGSWHRQLHDVDVAFVRTGGGVITVTVSCDRSLGFDEWCVVRDVVVDELAVEDPAAIEVVTYEFNNDYEGLRLDGAQALTLTAFDGAFERFYNKGDGVRHEVKVPKGASLVQLEALLSSGPTAYNVAATQFALAQDMRAMAQAVKGTNRVTVENNTQMRRLFEGFFQRVDKYMALLEGLREDTNVQNKLLISMGHLLAKRRRRRSHKPRKKTSRWQRVREKLPF